MPDKQDHDLYTNQNHKYWAQMYKSTHTITARRIIAHAEGEDSQDGNHEGEANCQTSVIAERLIYIALLSYLINDMFLGGNPTCSPRSR